MKKILFVCSHLYSGSSELCELLSTNFRIQQFSAKPYINPLNLLYLSNRKHKCNNRSAIYLDELLFNHDLSIKLAYEKCNFIYYLGSPRLTLEQLCYSGIKPLYALRYYTFRLRRLCEMAYRTPGALFLNHGDLPESIPLIENYLGVKGFVVNEQVHSEFPSVSFDFVKLAEESYEKTCYFLKNRLVCLNKL